METACIPTPLGIAKLEGDHNGISSLTLIDDTHAITEIIPEVLEDAVYQLYEYFAAKRKVFDLELHLEGTDFQKKVWQNLLKIPFGKTVSYLDLAKSLGDANAVRAVAAANGKNPLWILVPCHRVIGSDGSLTGYAGGLYRKEWLLAHESPVRQQSLF